MSWQKVKRWKKYFAVDQNYQVEHRFYLKSKKEQKKIQLIIVALAILAILLSLLFSWFLNFYLISILTISIVLSIIAPFFDMPSMKKSGKIIYCSPLFLIEKPYNGTLKIHGGSLFDYVFVLNKKMSGKQRTNFIIHQYLEGLLKLIEDYESGNLKDYTLKGTSYILKKRTLQKVGFEIKETDFVQKTILILNFFNLLISKSMAKAKLSLPKLANILTYETKISHLIDKKDYIESLNRNLAQSIKDREI